MKKLKSKIIIFNFVFLFCLVNCIVVKFIKIDSLEAPLEEEKLPILSNNGINIITPENLTYSRPMSGYYPGTFGFENDITGNIGTEISFVDYYSGNELAIINDEIGNHKKILKLIDQSTSEYLHISHNATQTYGTWEFWVYSNDSSKRFDFRIYSGGSPLLFVWLFIEDNKLIYHNGGSWVDVPNVPTIQNNTWYHVRIDFRCNGETTNWQGLNQNRWQLIIDGISSGELTPRASKTSIKELRLVSYVTHGDYCYYIDAIGFSWDPNYNIGDNLNEGLLLSFENQTALDWQGYSLDAQSNRTILGNTTIPMPEDGVHSIQVFGNDIVGTNYQSDIRYFTVDFPIDIITPEAKIYNEAMDGYYPATYGFDNVKNGTIPAGWTFFSNGGGESFVIDEVENHKDVLKLKHGGIISTYTQLKAPIFNPNVAGSVEWWMYYEDNGKNDGAALSISQGFPWESSAIIGLIGDGSVMYYNGVVQSFYGVGVYDLDTWHHIKVDLDCTTDKYNLTVDGTTIVSNIDFHGAIDYVDTVHVQSDQLSNCSVYYDAIGYSWESGYEIEENLNEGLLLSFENSTALDWIGYTLDGQLNRTIWGNTTIPLPHDGSHLIRVFGNDTSGTIFESNIRRFSVHHINIDTPEEKIYTKPMSGYYPATFGFENDDIGNSPEGWVIDAPNSGYVEVYPVIGGHNKIVIINDPDSAQYHLTRTLKQDQVNGTIEYWLYMTDVSQINLFQHRNSTLDTLMNYRVEGNKWQYRTTAWNNMKQSNGIVDMPAPSINTWYHVRIDFECGSGGYLELNPDSYQLIIDGVSSEELPFQNNGTSLHDINCRTDFSDLGYSYYIDAFGFSWDPNYNIGDNVYEGLLLSFQNTTALNWTGYSLDYQPVKTILGNTTFLMPENGLHTIQVFGNDSIGTNYKSEIRYFTIDYHPLEIITPENKTYMEPMSGYYPATYGFENDEDDETPEGWDDNSGDDWIKVVSDRFGHQKVLEAYDLNPGGWNLRHYFDNTEGTIEFWWAISSVASTQSHQVEVHNSTGAYLFGIQVQGGQLKVLTGGTWAAISGLTTTIYTWDHVRIDFRSKDGSPYEELNQNEYRLYYNGIDHGTYAFLDIGNPDKLRLYSGITPSDVYGYYDAFGFSWDPNYNVGDNLNEGLLLSFENSTNFEWIDYSLDSQSNKTILGNTTFSMPSEGIHRIQVYGNDTFGTDYESIIRYFTVNFPTNISIITPANTTYSQPMSGFYPATYGFENDVDRNFPSDWSVLEGGGKAIIIPELDGHKRIVEIHDNTTSMMEIINSFADQAIGTIEYYIRCEDNTNRTKCFIYDAADSDAVYLYFDNNGWLRFFNNTGPHDIITYESNQWYHLRIEWNCPSGKWYLWVDGVNTKSSGYALRGSPTAMNTIYFGTTGTELNYSSYIDAIGYSWDPNYNIGENLKEGLLLSYNVNGTLDWMGYSLDGQANKTILGNTTIPMPGIGVHNIQVFGSDVLGTNYHSIMIYFTISSPIITPDITAPNITINIPVFYQLFGSTAPNFNITIIELNLDSMWYTLDAGITNLTITEPTGMIEQAQWEGRPNGTVTIEFYANDTSDNIGSEQVSVRKDTLPPEITINLPFQDQIFRESAPTFDLSINDGNLDEIWYTLDDGLVNITCDTSGPILQEYWNALRPGDYILKIYADDSLGNLGFSEVSIKKKTQVISVYNPIIIFLIIITVIGVSTSIIKKKNKIECKLKVEKL